MPATAEFPTVVQDLMVPYADLFANDPTCWHIAEYQASLFTTEHSVVGGTNREFVATIDQSCLNCSLAEVDWHTDALNQRRLDLLPCDSATAYPENRMIVIDNTLIDHGGELIKPVAWRWEQAARRHPLAHDYPNPPYYIARVPGVRRLDESIAVWSCARMDAGTPKATA